MSRLLALAALGLFASALPSAAQTPDLAPLLGSFDKRCTFSAPLLEFRDSVARYDQKTASLVPGRAKMPPSLAGSVPSPVVANKGEWFEVKVPLVGTWNGLRVVGVEIVLGNHNGFSVLSVLFAESVGDVRKRLGVDWTEKGKTVERDGAPYSYGLKRTGGNVQAYCDVST